MPTTPRVFAVVGFALSLAAARPLAAIDIPTTFTLTSRDATYNWLNVDLTVTPKIPLAWAITDNEKPTVSGDCSATLGFVFDPVTHQATANQVTFDRQTPGNVVLADMHFTYRWYIFLLLDKRENIDFTGVRATPFTPTPPTAVSLGQFAAGQQMMALNGGTIQWSGESSGSQSLVTSPIDMQNRTSSSGTIAIPSPTMNGNLATYTVTVQLPLSFDETPIDDSTSTVRMVGSGTMKAIGTFQFDFGPRTVNWIAAAGSYSSGGNWDVGFVPRTGDTANFTGNTLAAVNVDVAQTVGRVLFSGGTNYTVSGAALTMDNTGGTGATAVISATASSHAISAQVATHANSDLGVSVSGTGSLNLSGGIDNAAAKTVTLTQTGGGTLSVGPIANAGLLNVAGGTATVGAVSGAGDTAVGAVSAATLITEHVRQDTLTINAGSSVKISTTGGASSTSVVNFLNIFNPTTGTFTWDAGHDGFTSSEALADSTGTVPVPEPATWLLVAVGALSWVLTRRSC